MNNMDLAIKTLKDAAEVLTLEAIKIKDLDIVEYVLRIHDLIAIEKAKQIYKSAISYLIIMKKKLEEL